MGVGAFLRGPAVLARRCCAPVGGSATQLARRHRGRSGRPRVEQRGPAVAGLWPPRIVLPEWALRLGDRERRLMLAHEDQHVRAWDPWLLAAAMSLLVLAPWNPVLWWQVRRLRLAVEMGCDARVLAHDGGAPAYRGRLLPVEHR